MILKTYLLDFGERSGNEDIESFAKVFQICYRKGGNIKDTVRSTYEILNDKMEIAEDIETVVTANKTEQNVMLIMPIGLIGMMKLMSPDFAENFVSPSGIMATTVAVIIFVATFYRKKSIGDKDLVMFGILDYICWILGLIFTIFWIFLFCKGKKNATLFQGLDEKEYPLKDIYFVGYELLELIKYNYRTKYDRRLRKEISVLKDGKYADYYIRVTRAQQVTLGYTLFTMSFAMYGLAGSMAAVTIFIMFAFVAFYYYGTSASDKIKKRSEELLSDFSKCCIKTYL